VSPIRTRAVAVTDDVRRDDFAARRWATSIGGRWHRGPWSDAGS
jgi:hypothetical protein